MQAGAATAAGASSNSAATPACRANKQAPKQSSNNASTGNKCCQRKTDSWALRVRVNTLSPKVAI
jgi:hypothetical protein